MAARWDILGLGIVAVDDLYYVAQYPQPDTKVAIQEQRREGGGLTGTALVAASRLGAKVAYAGVLGPIEASDSDPLSRFTVGAFEREGVDCSPVMHRDGAQPIHSIVIVDQSTGQRTILYSAEGMIARPQESITDELVRQCRVLFLDYSTGYGGLRAIELAHGRGIEVVGDVERLTVPGSEALMQQIDHLIVGVDLARAVTGEVEPPQMVRALSRRRVCCAVTVGEHGCWYSERGGPVRHMPAYRVSAVDTTGCGDVFHGAYAASIARGEGVADAIQIAAAAAAIKATQPGGRSGIPDWAAVQRLLDGGWNPFNDTHAGNADIQ
jgi:sugar/nucleoside kinase (ribokinase family)